MSNKLTVIKNVPEWHAEAVDLINQNFASIHSAFLDATKKAVWLGLFFIHIKQRGKEDKSIPHGEFGPWLKKNVPALSWDTCCSYMHLAKDVSEKGKFQISDFPKFAHGGQLPAPILKIVEGKTQQQLFLEFKQAKGDAEGNLIPTRGRRPGEGGRPPEAKGTIEEIAATLKKKTLRQIGKAADGLEAAGINFIALTDGEITAAVAAFERTAKCMNAWLNTPPAKRDAKEIQKLWKTL